MPVREFYHTWLASHFIQLRVLWSITRYSIGSLITILVLFVTYLRLN
jgi:hypothetical protein